MEFFCYRRRPKKQQPLPDEVPPEKLSQEAYRLLRTVQSLLEMQEPNLIQQSEKNIDEDRKFLEQLAKEFPPVRDPHTQRAGSFSMSPKASRTEKEGKMLNTAFSRKLSLQLTPGELRRNSVSRDSGRLKSSDSTGLLSTNESYASNGIDFKHERVTHHEKTASLQDRNYHQERNNHQERSSNQERINRQERSYHHDKTLIHNRCLQNDGLQLDRSLQNGRSQNDRNENSRDQNDKDQNDRSQNDKGQNDRNHNERTLNDKSLLIDRNLQYDRLSSFAQESPSSQEQFLSLQQDRVPSHDRFLSLQQDRVLSHDRLTNLQQDRISNQDRVASQERLSNQDRLNQDKSNQDRLIQDKSNQDRLNPERSNSDRLKLDRSNSDRSNHFSSVQHDRLTALHSKKLETENGNSPPASCVSSTDAESGFSSMNSFQEVGIPLMNALINDAYNQNGNADKLADSHKNKQQITLEEIKLWQKSDQHVHKRWNSTPSEVISSSDKMKVFWV